MAVQKKFALGRGLDALISTEEVKTSGSSSISENKVAERSSFSESIRIAAFCWPEIKL